MRLQRFSAEINRYMRSCISDGKASIQHIILSRFSLFERSVTALSSEWLKLNEFKCHLELSPFIIIQSIKGILTYQGGKPHSLSDKISMISDFNLKCLFFSVKCLKLIVLRLPTYLFLAQRTVSLNLGYTCFRKCGRTGLYVDFSEK